MAEYTERETAWMAVFNSLVDQEKARLKIKHDYKLAALWNIDSTMFSTMRSDRNQSKKLKTYFSIDAGLHRSGREQVKAGWFKQLYDICHPPTERFREEVAEHLARGGFLDEHTAIKTSAGVITAAVQVKGRAHACRKIPVVTESHNGDPAALIEGDETSERIYCPEYATDDPRAFAFRVCDESMTPHYLPGDIVVISPSRAVAPAWPVVYKVVGEPIGCKTFHDLDDRIEFVPINPICVRVAYDKGNVEWIYPVVGMVREERESTIRPSTGQMPA